MSDDTIEIPLAEVAPEISESLRQVLASHGYVVAKRTGFGLIGLTASEQDDLITEAGRNTAQVLAALDVNEELFNVPTVVP